MADAKLTALAAKTTPEADDLVYLVDDPLGTPAEKKITMANLLSPGFAINTAYATVASHATTSAIWAALGNIINFTGAETVTDFPAADRAGASRTLICAGATVFTHAGNITVQGGATFTAAANQVVTVIALTTTTFFVLPTPLSVNNLALLGANTFTGAQTLGAGASIVLNEKTILVDAALSTNSTWTGPTQSVTAGEDLTIGEVCYLKSDGKYWLADADAEATADTKLVMATASISADAAGVVLLPSALSFMRVDATTEWTVTGAGDVMYLSTTAGELTNDVSGYTTDDIVRVCGYMETSTVLCFDVDKTFITVA